MTIRILIMTCILMSVAFLVFSGTLGHDFVNWDDDVYVYDNDLVKSGNDPWWWFGHTYYYSYVPLTMLSHSLDYAMYGGTPRGHHLTNVILHAFNTGWLFLLGLTLMGARRGISGGTLVGMLAAVLLFSLHPLRVESVAWVSDRKDLLCTFFLVPATTVYIQYVRLRETSGGIGYLILTFILFVCAVLSKSVAIGFPLIMLVIDWYLSPSRAWRHNVQKWLIEKWGFLLVSAATAILLLLVPVGGRQSFAVEQLQGAETLGFPFYTFTFYLWKTILPVGLAPIYPAVGTMWLVTGVIVFVVVSALAVVLARRGRRALLASWIAYLVFLIPTVVGLSSGMQAQADRFSYLATMPFYLLLGGGFALLIGRGPGLGRLLAGAAIAVVIVAAASVTLRYSMVWASSEQLWTYVYESFPPSRDYVDAYVNLGSTLADQMKLPEAETVLRTAISVDSSSADAFYNLGHVLYLQGDWEQAADLFLHTTTIDSGYARGYYNYAIITSQLGRDDLAIPAMRRAARIGMEAALVALRNSGIPLADSTETSPGE